MMVTATTSCRACRELPVRTSFVAAVAVVAKRLALQDLLGFEMAPNLLTLDLGSGRMLRGNPGSFEQAAVCMVGTTMYNDCSRWSLEGKPCGKGSLLFTQWLRVEGGASKRAAVVSLPQHVHRLMLPIGASVERLMHRSAAELLKNQLRTAMLCRIVKDCMFRQTVLRRRAGARCLIIAGTSRLWR